jgi:uncharacterized membrane protein
MIRGIEVQGVQPGRIAISRVSAGQAVAVSAALAAVAWALTADVRESLLLDKRQDLGHFTQAIWATAHGHFLQVTEAGGTDVNRLGIHVDPIVALFTPLWLIWPSPKLLLTVQAFALAAGAAPVFWLARKHLSRESDAALLAAAYLLCPTIGWNAISDFHPVALAVPFLLFAIWYLDDGRLIAFAVAAGAAMLCQEQIGLLVAGLGVWHVWRTRRLRPGLIVAAVGVAVSLVDVLVVLRHFSGGSPFASRFGGSPTGLAGDLFIHPLRLVNQINAHDLLGLLLALPVLGCCFGSSLLAAAAPQVGLLLLSRRAADWDWFGINVLLTLPFIYAATVYALARRATRSRRKRLNARWVFLTSLVIAILLGPFSMFAVAGPWYESPSSVDAQRGALSLIPKNARVSATDHLALPLSTRRYIFVFPVLTNADWVVVDSRDDELPNMSYLQHRVGIEVGVNDLSRQPVLMLSELQKLKTSPNWKLVYRRDDVYVFKRIKP